MSKREKIRLIKSVWMHLMLAMATAVVTKNEIDFDWYSDGQYAFWCALNDKPYVHQKRIKALDGKLIAS